METLVSNTFLVIRVLTQTFYSRGCVTPDILRKLARVDIEHAPGFINLKHADQAKIRRAITRKQVDPEDVPASAKPFVLPSSSQVTTSTTASKSGKRKASEMAGQSSSQVSSSSQVPSTHRSSGLMSGNVIEIEDDDEEQAQETRDELYCVLNTQVVGIQYYTGRRLVIDSR